MFSGEGWTVIPWLNDAKIAVTFTSITVNTDRQLISGYIDARYDANPTKDRLPMSMRSSREALTWARSRPA